MSISRCSFLAAIVVSLVATAVHADDLAATVAAKMKESGALKGYRVAVKAKAGTVWLEGTVSDARQIDAAIAAAEGVAGVERVVNRLAVAAQGSDSDSLSLPASIRQLVGLPTPAPIDVPLPIAAVDPAAEQSRGEQAVLANLESDEADNKPAITLTRAAGDEQSQASAAGRSRPARKASPRPLGAQAARPVPQPRGGRTADSRVRRTALRNQVEGAPLELPGPDEGYVVGEQGVIGGYQPHAGVADGQMVPGSMRFTEGPAGGYCPPGQGGAGGPVPMNAAMGGPGGMGGAGGMPVPVRGDGPNMPNYAWPSYAAYPNYAALQYPTQYSPTAWPYIGPFYPYPQVPLGWRRVSLEWDDGWWWLDFDERHIHSHHR